MVGLANSATASGLSLKKVSLATGDICVKICILMHQTIELFGDRGLHEVIERMHMYLQCGPANECGAAVDIRGRLFQLKHFNKQTTLIMVYNAQLITPNFGSLDFLEKFLCPGLYF